MAEECGESMAERHSQNESILVRFARQFGWRAYAIPVLIVLTIWVIVDIVVSDPKADTAATNSGVITVGEGPTMAAPDPAADAIAALPGGTLPAGGAYTMQGEKTFRTVGSPQPRVGQGEEKTFTYIVQVENGVNTAGYGGDEAFAAMVDATLKNPKSWINDPKFAFEHVGEDVEPDFTVQLTSVNTTHEGCGAEIDMETSCFTSIGNRVLINESRWVRGTGVFAGDIGSYRQYVLNHEIGHAIGFAEHTPCGADGELAPIMMQQTLSLNNSELFSITPEGPYPDDHKTCRYNPWPFPHA